ncbi:MAG TPA: transcription-repair coupling factor, partial [Calditrichaeota bacterium]|nr:transcription-repair coupling factor [Calditrichota bacterium]
LTTKTLVESNLVADNSIDTVYFGVHPHPDFGGSLKRFLEYVKKRSEEKNHPQIYIQALNQSQAERLQEIIDEEEISFNGKCLVGTLHNGFRLDEINLELLTDHEIFNRFKRRRTYKRFKSSSYLRQLSSLNLYDYVVHVDYGIGQYMGMETMEFGDVKKECLKIAYADGDYLFVTVDRLNRVQKYSTEEGIRPKLTRLGGSEWDRTKKKTKESIKKIAAELIRIYAGRKALGGHSFAEDNHWQKELEASFMFEETEDQLKSIAEVKRDMEREQPMDRLLCGDVGFGKTEVAIRACFKVVMNGKQAAVLVPTTILAFQHYQTFKERMREFPVEVEMINRFRTSKEQRQILEKLAAGQVDIIIGTHRLLSEDVRFKDLGLLVIDEEQRFGVKQKEKLKKYRLSVDILSMTATPIPRTLHMALMGARDLSNIDTPPRNRLPVHTEIIHWDDDKLHFIIRREIERGGQIYFVHNRVETIQAVKESLQQIIPQARIAVGHGQLPERQLEKVMLDFMNKKYDILLATMIIENGLDISNVNTIVINRADKFGLSQLYQLRGRVGRSDQQAYAYLIVPPVDKLSATARKRLHAIQDFTDLGSGYKVALRDLEIRGAGNLLGKEQSGFVQSVGFDLYCKILDEAVNELKKGRGELLDEGTETVAEQKPHTDPKLDVDFDLLIPESYLPSELERITVYHRLVNFTHLAQIEQMREELRDRFGKLPAEVNDFLAAIEIKILAGRLYAERVIVQKDRLKLVFSKKAQEDDHFFNEMIPTMMRQKLSEVRFLNQKNLGVEFRLKGKVNADRLPFAKKILANILENK